MRVEIAEASSSDGATLSNLLSLYLHDFSEVLGGAPGPDGRFVYDRLPLYFAEPGRTALLVRADGSLGGFALVSRGSVVTGAPDVWDLSEFFVVRGLRRRGVGRTAASAVFRRFPGPWEVRALERNAGAVAFWTQVISQHTRRAFEVQPWVSENGAAWRVFRFSEPRPGDPAPDRGAASGPAAGGPDPPAAPRRRGPGAARRAGSGSASRLPRPVACPRPGRAPTREPRSRAPPPAHAPNRRGATATGAERAARAPQGRAVLRVDRSSAG
jgi:predicted acetyltransferase